MTDLSDIITPILVALPAIGAAWFAYKRGTKADDKAADNIETSQIFTGYGTLVKTLQDDNASIRVELAGCKAAMEERVAALEAMIAQIIEGKP